MVKQLKWLVTGGAGFIGSHITDRLLTDGHFVRVLDNFYSGKEENLAFALKRKNFELLKGDIRDKAICQKACKGIDHITHQAALRSVPKSLELPHDYNAVNIDGSLNILESALKAKVKRVVIASSSSIYGEAVKFPEKETDQPLLVSPYALSKLAVEHYSRIFSITYGLPTVNLRYFNVFGPKQALDDDYAVVIPKFITCMLNNEQPPIHGDGKQSRDFTYIDNVVDANILAATTPGIECEVLNVALGKDSSILDLVSILNNIMGKKIKPKHEPSRPGDVRRSLADTTRIKKVLGFAPKVDFKEGLKRTVDWFAQQQAAKAAKA